MTCSARQGAEPGLHDIITLPAMDEYSLLAAYFLSVIWTKRCPLIVNMQTLLHAYSLKSLLTAYFKYVVIYYTN